MLPYKSKEKSIKQNFLRSNNRRLFPQYQFPAALVFHFFGNY